MLLSEWELVPRSLRRFLGPWEVPENSRTVHRAAVGFWTLRAVGGISHYPRRQSAPLRAA